MIPIQNEKFQVLLAPGSLTAAGTNVSSVIDMSGYAQASIYLHAASSTTTALPEAILIQHSDIIDSTGFSTIVSAGTASTGYPTQVTNATQVTSQTDALAGFHVSWLGKKRYLRISATGPTAGTCTAFAGVVMSRSQTTPTGTNAGAKYVAISA